MKKAKLKSMNIVPEIMLHCPKNPATCDVRQVYDTGWSSYLYSPAWCICSSELTKVYRLTDDMAGTSHSVDDINA